MNNIVKFPDRQAVQEQASLWLVKLDSGNLSEEDSYKLREWLDEDPQHQESIIELTMLWDKMDVLSELSQLFPLARKTRLRFIDFVQAVKFPSIPVITISITALLVIGIITFINIGLQDNSGFNPPLLETIYQTSVGEQTEINLPDGSDTTLNTDSVVEVAYSQDQRNIRLIKGEAHFKVTHDDSRPFVVHAGKGIIKAVGTAFSVYLKDDDDVEVIVTEGRVEIVSAVENSNESYIDIEETEPERFLTTLDAGHSAEYSNEAIYSVQQVEEDVISRRLSWQHGELVFEGNPLEEVVEEISRYTDMKIVINDPEIRNIRVGGFFKTGETEALLSVLENNFDVRVERFDENLIFLTGAGIQQATNDL